MHQSCGAKEMCSTCVFIIMLHLPFHNFEKGLWHMGNIKFNTLLRIVGGLVHSFGYN